MMAHDQNVSRLCGGNESQAGVLCRPVSAPGLRANVSRLTPVLLARLRPIGAGEAFNRFSGTRDCANGSIWTQRNEYGALNAVSAI